MKWFLLSKMKLPRWVFFFSSFSHCNRIKHSSGKQLWLGTNLSRVQVDMVEWWCCSAQGPRAHRLRARLELISFYCGLCCFTPPTYFPHFPPLLPPNPPTHTRAHTRSRSARRHETLLQRRERAAGSLWNLFFFLHSAKSEWPFKNAASTLRTFKGRYEEVKCSPASQCGCRLRGEASTWIQMQPPDMSRRYSRACLDCVTWDL